MPGGRVKPRAPAHRPMHRYVFVGGLHRSGTSLVASLLAEHPDIAAIEGAPVPENEGCYLQGAIPHTAQHGIPGHFATDPAQHHVEGCALDRLDTRERLEADWAPWFDPGKPWRVEKSPVNLTRMRLLQALFPLAQFIVVTRHPAFTTEAMRKWIDVEERRFPRHWCDAHDIVFADIEHLHGVMIVRYEDLVGSPAAVRDAMFAFLGLGPCDTRIKVANGNRRYSASAQHSALCYPALGYAPGGVHVPFAPVVRHPLRAVRDMVTAIMAAQHGKASVRAGNAAEAPISRN